MKYLLMCGRQEYLKIMQRCLKTKHYRDMKKNGCIFPFIQKGNFAITKNYWGIFLTAIAAKV